MRTAVTDPLAGAVLDGRYRIDGVLATGGMSTVYRGTDLRLDRTVAVKVMAHGLAQDPGFVERFGREARAAAKLAHPNAVPVFDQGDDSGRIYLVMELVEGRTLRTLLREHGRLDPALALTVVESVLAALSSAHRLGLVHRDVKPENVLIGDTGTVKVVDFGLVRAVAEAGSTAQTGSVLGTVSYMAPESVTRGTTDARTDVYSTGVLLYELLTGVPPYSGDTAISVAYRHVHDDVPPPSHVVAGLPEPVDSLVLRATRRDPGARPVDAGAFLAELRDVRADAGLPVVPIPAPPARPRHAADSDAAGGTSILQPDPAGYGAASPPAPPNGTDEAATEAVAPGMPAARGFGASSPPPILRPLPRDEPAPPPMPPPMRRRRRRWPFLVGTAVVLLLVAGVATTGWWFGAGRYTHVPTLARLSVQDARRTAQAHHLTLKVLPGRRHSENVPAGAIVSADPGAGSKVRRGATVQVRLSSGPQRYTLPGNLIGATRQAAVQALQPLPLHPNYPQQYSDSVPTGHVIGIDPSPGTPMARGESVTVTISRGPAPFTVPDVTGQSQGDAQATLQNAGLQVQVSQDFSDTVPQGSVISQNPSGSQVHRGDTVTITVSKGPQLVAVPDIERHSLSDAEQALAQVGLKADVHKVFGGTLGLVVKVRPKTGTMVPAGSVVELTVI